MTFKSLLAGVVLSLGTAVAANAATLGYTATTPWATTANAQVDFDSFSTTGDLLAFGLEVTNSSFTMTSSTFLDFSLGYTLADPTDGTATGGFSLIDENRNSVSSANVIGVGFLDGVLEIAFNTVDAFISGVDVSPATSVIALLTVDFGTGAGTNPFSVLANGGPDTYSVDATLSAVEMSPIPVPATLPLLLVGVGAMGIMRRRQRNS